MLTLNGCKAGNDTQERPSPTARERAGHKNLAMTTAQSSHPWIARFCIYLLQQLPSITARAAIQQAVARYPYCADQAPEMAAQWLLAATHRPQGALHSSPARIGSAR